MTGVRWEIDVWRKYSWGAGNEVDDVIIRIWLPVLNAGCQRA